jgi:hypothetical protein
MWIGRLPSCAGDEGCWNAWARAKEAIGRKNVDMGASIVEGPGGGSSTIPGGQPTSRSYVSGPTCHGRQSGTRPGRRESRRNVRGGEDSCLPEAPGLFQPNGGAFFRSSKELSASFQNSGSKGRLHVGVKPPIPDLGVVFGQPRSQFLKLTRRQGPDPASLPGSWDGCGDAKP